MNFRTYLWCMAVITLVAWSGWLFVLFTIDPSEAGWLGLILFYITLFAAMIGTFAVGGTLFRVMSAKHKTLMSREVKITFRHAIMVSVVGIASLALSAQNLFRSWMLVVMLAVVGVIEYAFLLIQESRRT